jgi:hypothetical protein
MNSELKMKMLIMGISIFCVTTKSLPVLRSSEFDRRFNSLAINLTIFAFVCTKIFIVQQGAFRALQNVFVSLSPIVSTLGDKNII